MGRGSDTNQDEESEGTSRSLFLSFPTQGSALDGHLHVINTAYVIVIYVLFGEHERILWPSSSCAINLRIRYSEFLENCN